MHGWMDQKRQIRVFKSPYQLFAYKVESFFLYKFFVVYEIQLNQKNYDISFKCLIIMLIKTLQILIKI
jgi:hypothetical protein